MKQKKVDRFFLTIVILLIFVGLAMFVSATFGILAKNPETFYSVLFSQLVLGLGFGLVGLLFFLKIDYKFWKKYAFYIFLGTLILTTLVFLPYIGWTHGGATRWIKLGPLGTFQPVEFLKFGFVIYFAAWLSWAKNRVSDIKYSILPLLIMLGLIALILFKQPDTKSFILIAVTALTMLFVSNVPMKYILGIGTIVIAGLFILLSFTPYLQERVKTYVNPSYDSLGSSYQIQQSMIAIGSGGMFGRGFGQSIQKFSYLPEPQGDSIFAVVGEELGFLGSIAIIILYALFALRGLHIANRSPDLFSRLLVTGIVILITVQSFMNIASIIGVFPLTGVPLVFMSHGGTSLMVYLLSIGIVLNISRYQIKS